MGDNKGWVCFCSTKASEKSEIEQYFDAKTIDTTLRNCQNRILIQDKQMSWDTSVHLYSTCKGLFTLQLVSQNGSLNGLRKACKLMAVPSIHVRRSMCRSNGIMPGKPLNGWEAMSRQLGELRCQGAFHEDRSGVFREPSSLRLHSRQWGFLRVTPGKPLNSCETVRPAALWNTLMLTFASSLHLHHMQIQRIGSETFSVLTFVSPFNSWKALFTHNICINKGPVSLMPIKSSWWRPKFA